MGQSQRRTNRGESTSSVLRTIGCSLGDLPLLDYDETGLTGRGANRVSMSRKTEQTTEGEAVFEKSNPLQTSREVGLPPKCVKRRRSPQWSLFNFHSRHGKMMFDLCVLWQLSREIREYISMLRRVVVEIQRENSTWKLNVKTQRENST